MKAAVVFSDAGNHWLAPLLKPGFRHVAVAVRTEGGLFVGIDPSLGTPEIAVLDEDVPTTFRAKGYTVVETWTQNTEPRWPFAFANCVGVVKAVLGIRNAAIWTPWQLYRHLMGETR